MGCFYIICKIFGFVEINIVKGYSLFIDTLNLIFFRRSRPFLGIIHPFSFNSINESAIFERSYLQDLVNCTFIIELIKQYL